MDVAIKNAVYIALDKHILIGNQRITCWKVHKKFIGTDKHSKA